MPTNEQLFNEHTYNFTQPFYTDSGETLDSLEIVYHTAGKLNAAGDNVIWICHALTANSNPQDWWEGMFDNKALFDPERDFIVCANILGSCYGSSGPLSASKSGTPYFHDFPELTIRDIVAAHILLKDHLKISKIKCLIGGSMGGQQAQEWAVMEPGTIKNMVLLATNARHSAWGIAYNESQRWAIETDPSWPENKKNAGLKGLEAARSIALLSYRSYQAYSLTQTDKYEGQPLRKAASYQRYQGKKLSGRFNAFSYYRLSQAMDSHDLSRGRSKLQTVLATISAHTLVISITDDQLFPSVEQQFLADHIPNSALEIVKSPYGHDGFLIETNQIKNLIKKHLTPIPSHEKTT